MTLDNYTLVELNEIVKRHEDHKEYVRDYKSTHPASSEQRKLWNKRHYENRKNRADFKETQQKYYKNNREIKCHSSRHYYYKKNNILDKLKIKYPETYNMYYTIDGETRRL